MSSELCYHLLEGSCNLAAQVYSQRPTGQWWISK